MDGADRSRGDLRASVGTRVVESAASCDGSIAVRVAHRYFLDVVRSGLDVDHDLSLRLPLPVFAIARGSRLPPLEIQSKLRRVGCAGPPARNRFHLQAVETIRASFHGVVVGPSEAAHPRRSET